MQDRPWLIPVAATALFAAGVATGYWLRGEPFAAGSAANDGGSTSTESNTSAAAPASGDATDGGASAADGTTAAAERAEADAVPSGTGSVSVVGGSDEGGTPPSSGAVSDDESGQAVTVPSGDAGRPRGRLDAAAIRDVVRDHRDELGFCFAWQLHSQPELAGRLTMQFTIGADGQVAGAEVIDDELGDETVLRCFRRVTERMEFPAPEDGGEVTVRYPFILRPDGESDGDGESVDD